MIPHSCLVAVHLLTYFSAKYFLQAQNRIRVPFNNLLENNFKIAILIFCSFQKIEYKNKIQFQYGKINFNQNETILYIVI